MAVEPSGFDTATSDTEPGGSDGDEIWSRVEPKAVAETAAPPMETDAPGWNWLPTRTTAVPPVEGPDVTVA